MTPQPLSSSQLRTMLLEAKSKGRLLLTRSDQEICPSESVISAHQKQLSDLDQQGQSFFSDSSQRPSLPAYRIQLMLEPGNRKRPRESDLPNPSQPKSPSIDWDDRVLQQNHKRRCTEIQQNQPDDPPSSDTKSETQPQHVGHTADCEVSNSPTDKRDEPGNSPEAKPPTCRSPEIDPTEPDQQNFKVHNPNETTGPERPATSIDDHCSPGFGPSVKTEVTDVGAESPRDAGGMPQDSEGQPWRGISVKEESSPSASTDRDESQLSSDTQPAIAQKDDEGHSIPTPQESPDWPLFGPDELFEGHSSAECSNPHLLFEVPDSPMHLFEADSPTCLLWEDELPPAESLASDVSQPAKSLCGSDTMNPAHLDQRLVDNALINKPPGREHPLYKGIRGPDGLYHCPWEKETGCNHKPAKLKCTFDKFIDSHIKPYNCRVPDCQSGSFSSTACLFRHEREAHALHGYGDKPYLCPQEGCERATPGNGFPRRWNLVDHMRRRHKLDAPIPDIVDSRTSRQIKMENKKGTKENTKEGTKKDIKEDAKDGVEESAKSSAKESVSPPAKGEVDLESQWEAHREAFRSVLDKLNDPEDPRNAEWAEEAQRHLSAMAEIQAKMEKEKQEGKE